MEAGWVKGGRISEVARLFYRVEGTCPHLMQVPYDARHDGRHTKRGPMVQLGEEERTLTEGFRRGWLGVDAKTKLWTFFASTVAFPSPSLLKRRQASSPRMLVADQLALMAASWQAVRGASRWGGMTKCGGGADGATARGKSDSGAHAAQRRRRRVCAGNFLWPSRSWGELCL